MKSRKRKKFLLKAITFSIFLTGFSLSYAAQENIFWGDINDYPLFLKNFTLTRDASISKGLQQLPDLNRQKTIINTLKFVSGHTDQWSVDNAYRVMLDVNMNYWTKGTT